MRLVLPSVALPSVALPIVALAGAGLLLAGCVETIAESRVKKALVEAGLSDRNASCMAERMVDRLTISQLRKLEALRPAEGEEAMPRNLRQFVARVQAVNDTEVIAVTTSSAALCATGLAG